jgi:hypothetical protein
MAIKKYIPQDVEFNGRAIYMKDKKVINSSTYGMITIPTRFIGEDMDIILIPKNID